MKIKIYEAEVNIGFACPKFRGADKAKVIADIAKTCRRDWKDPVCGGWDGYWAAQGKEESSKAPEMPDTDEEVVKTYFWCDEDDPDERWINWDEFEVDYDMGAPYDRYVVICGELIVKRIRGRNTATLLTGDGATLEGTLEGVLGDMPYHIEVLERLILALTASGFPVHTPEFSEAVDTVMDGIVNNSDYRTADEIEEVERAVTEVGYQISLNRMFDKWTINVWKEAHWESLKGENLFASRVEALEWAAVHLINLKS